MNRSSKLLTIVSLLIVIVLGFSCKFYRGFAQEWVNNYLAGVWYEVFWCLLIFIFIFNKKAIILIPILVFILTCLVEILQLWHHPVLELIRSYTIGRFLIGTSFSVWDFPHYLVGCLLGFFWLKRIYNLPVKT